MSEKLVLYTVAEICAMTGRSPRTIRRWFRDLEGVIKLDNVETMHKRRYCSLRVPRAVLERVLQSKNLC